MNRIENEAFVGEGDTDFELEELKINRNIGLDVTDKLPLDIHVSNWYIAGIIISVFCHIMDVGLDINLAYQYYIYCHSTYFLLTSLFIVVPSLIITLVSARMYAMETKPSIFKRIIRMIVLVFQLAPILRYYEVFYFAIKSKEAEKNIQHEKQRKYYTLLVKEDANISLLRVLECLLESAPQQILQIAILLNSKYYRRSSILEGYQISVICTSVVSIAWSISLYNRSIRFARQNKNNISWPATIVQFMWHFFITSSRILSISEIASIFPQSTAMACCIHWILMAWWLYFYDRTQFCYNSDNNKKQPLMEALFCCLLGFLYIFVYLSPTDGRTRNKYIFYYSIYFIELFLSVYVWYSYTNIISTSYWWFPCLFLSPLVTFLFGVAFMLLYYNCCHPETNIGTFCCIKKQNSFLLPQSVIFNVNVASVGTQTDLL